MKHYAGFITVDLVEADHILRSGGITVSMVTARLQGLMKLSRYIKTNSIKVTQRTGGHMQELC